MICNNAPGCSTILGSKINVWRGKYYCDKCVQVVSAAPVTNGPVTSVCQRCSTDIRGGAQSTFAARAQGKPDINVVLCPNCTNEWTEGSSRVIYDAMTVFLGSGQPDSENEPEFVTEPEIPDPVVTLSPRPGQPIVIEEATFSADPQTEPGVSFRTAPASDDDPVVIDTGTGSTVGEVEPVSEVTPDPPR